MWRTAFWSSLSSRQAGAARRGDVRRPRCWVGLSPGHWYRRTAQAPDRRAAGAPHRSKSSADRLLCLTAILDPRFLNSAPNSLILDGRVNKHVAFRGFTFSLASESSSLLLPSDESSSTSTVGRVRWCTWIRVGLDSVPTLKPNPSQEDVLAWSKEVGAWSDRQKPPPSSLAVEVAANNPFVWAWCSGCARLHRALRRSTGTEAG